MAVLKFEAPDHVLHHSSFCASQSRLPHLDPFNSKAMASHSPQPSTIGNAILDTLKPDTLQPQTHMLRPHIAKAQHKPSSQAPKPFNPKPWPRLLNLKLANPP